VRKPITINTFAQTGDNEPITAEIPKKIVQNRINPIIKQREIVPMINEVTQTTPIIEGKIKKQRFHRFIEKN
jgi:hypothetical protein